MFIHTIIVFCKYKFTVLYNQYRMKTDCIRADLSDRLIINKIESIVSVYKTEYDACKIYMYHILFTFATYNQMVCTVYIGILIIHTSRCV